MKPKTRLEKKLVAYASQLPAITERQRTWAIDNCFRKSSVYTRHGRRIKCLCCGREVRYAKDEKIFFESWLRIGQYDCEYCGRTTDLVEKYTNNSQLRDQIFFSIITTFRGVQLIRTFDAQRDNTGDSTRFCVDEIFQNWIMPDGKEIITGRPHHRSAFALSFDCHLPYQIKQHNASTNGAFAFDDMFDVCGCTFYPVVRVTPLVKRNGWRQELLPWSRSLSMVDVISWLLKCPTAEMLCKTGQLDLFRHMVRESKTELDYLHSVRIANRRNYMVDDASLWLDMLRMADRLGLDTHNPQIVCPADLHAAHDRLLARYTKFVRKEKNTHVFLTAGPEYKKHIAPYRNISISAPGIVISVIPSIEKVCAEGEAMHHCVFTMKYYDKKDTLLLSAVDQDGNRLETIELSLKNYKVRQSRGAFNKLTPRHNEIITLIENNAALFRKAAHA